MEDLAIVIPAYNAEHFLPQSLSAAVAAARGRTVLVVDAGSDDGTARRAETLGARVLRLEHRAGPAEARNAGARAVDAEVVLFLDADCVAHFDLVGRVLTAFAAEPGLVSVTGSYDDDPPERNFASSYMNLRHCWTHQRARRERSGFWAGCGAVRREAFLRAGGFDEQRYPVPMIEDIELGLRLARLGMTRLDPRLQVRHLKRWTLRSVVLTDIRRRAIPWSELILETGSMPDDLNLRRSQRFAAVLAPWVLLALPILPWAVATRRRELVAACAAAIVLAVALNLDLLRFFAKRRGRLFAVAAFVFHQVHLVYSAATLAGCTLRFRLRGGRSRGTRTPA
jgi:glycosyltransferase involved in cell wall biosynthesis